MRLGSVLLAASLATALLFSSLAFLAVRHAAAQEVRPAQPPCTCSTPRQVPGANPRPRLADHSRGLDDSDELATLEAIRVALTEVADGSSFAWHRDSGRLSGVVQPTASFKDASGRVCRHLVLVLSAGARNGRVEGVACRLTDGRWQLEG